MRAIRVAPVALLGSAALALTAPATAAHATTNGPGTSFTPSVTPSVIAPGGRVTLGAMGCDVTATASAGVFDTTTIPSGQSATATVDWDARRGAVYEVTFNCGGTVRMVGLTITGGATSTPTRTPRPTTTPTRTVPTVSSTALAPSGVRGGLGGSVDGFGAGEIAAGGALVLAAAGGTVYAVRRRRGSH
ncbi:hypothetical protein [Streptomyces fulvorobeus]|uniref:Lipoprotein n=1 Tax=Streptomyces fulvorobeus TaxID=284028 RepID=A0A7J0CDT7_9ACTN|nr:hypothetical protein [Streptomyces fulvorobeus]NYE44170.1 hypothetical protein [Streptomyces fulvorobeus]GFN00682.1 hypothetical protein Sfulv_54920 [Streptomyces fulvorobeus]